MADDPEPPADREVLTGVGQQAAHNARDVAGLEERLNTLTAALAEVLQVLRILETGSSSPYIMSIRIDGRFRLKWE